MQCDGLFQFINDSLLLLFAAICYLYLCVLAAAITVLHLSCGASNAFRLDDIVELEVMAWMLYR